MPNIGQIFSLLVDVKQWLGLNQGLDCFHLRLYNNVLKSKIQPPLIFCKKYIIAGSHAAAVRIAMMYSFFGSCKANDIHPYEWLKDTLERIPETKITDLEKLLPVRKV